MKNIMNADQEQHKVTMPQKVVNYTRALSRWIKSGRPVRKENEINRLFMAHCAVCEAFDERSSSCYHCGCRVNTSNVAPLNKIAMKTEHCPLEKW